VSSVVTKKIRCLVVGCNPKMIATGDESTPVTTWSGDKNFKKHQEEHPDHRIAKAPERSAEGKLKQTIRNKTGVYPADLEKYKAKKAEDEKLASERRAEKAAKAIENKRKAEEERKASEIRKAEAAIKREKELKTARENRAKTITKFDFLNLDKTVLKDVRKDTFVGANLIDAATNLVKYGEDIRLKHGNDSFKIFKKLLEKELERIQWETGSKRESFYVAGTYTADEMRKREEFIKEWEALTEKGLSEGWLEWTNDYSGSHVVSNISNVNEGRREESFESTYDYCKRVSMILVEVKSNVEADFNKILEARKILKDFSL